MGRTIRLSPTAAFAATTTAGYGVLFYAYGVLLVPMEQSLGWPRTFFTGVFSLASLIGALLTIPVGRWLDRHSPRSLLLPGAIVTTIAVAAWSVSQTQLVFLAVWMVLGACQAIMFYEPAFTTLTKWYDGAARHRAVTAVTLLGGLASTIFGPLTAAVDAALGWSGAVLVLAAILGMVAIPAFTFGLDQPREVAPRGEAHHLVPLDAFKDARLWLLTLTYLLSLFTAVAVGVLVVAFLRERGIGAGVAATALGGIGLVQVLGRGVFSRFGYLIPAIRLGTWVMVAKAAGLVLLLVVPGIAGVLAFVVVYGAANGVSTLTRALSVADLVGADHYGSISGAITSVGAVAGAVAPVVAAVAIEAVGRPGPVWAAFAVLNIAAAVTNHLASSKRLRPPAGVAVSSR